MKNKVVKITCGIICICFLGIAVYSNTLNSPFQFDDSKYILDSYPVLSVQNTTLFNTPKVFLNNIRHQLPPQKRFFTSYTFALNYFFFQDNPFSYHCVNILIHILASLLVWWFMTLVFSVPDISKHQGGGWYQHKEEIAFLISVLFLVHPIQTQAVTYISQRFTSLAGMFYLLSVCMYLKGRLEIEGSGNFSPTPHPEEPLDYAQGKLRDEGSQRSFGPVGPQDDHSVTTVKNTPTGHLAKSKIWAVVYFLGAALSAVLGMFSKETAFTLPFCIFLMEFSFFKGKRSKLFWRSMICVLLFILLIPYLYSFKIAGVFSRHANHGITSVKYFMTQFRVIVTYIRLLFFPVGQNVDYDFSLSQSIFELRTCLSLVILLIILMTAIIIFRRQMLIAFGIFWFFLALSVESGIIPILDVMFEHRLYLPSIGFFIIVCILSCNFIKDFRKFLIVFSVIVLTLSYLTFQRNKVWQSEISLWKDTVKKSPGKARPYHNLGSAYLRQKDYISAIMYLNKAIKLKPGVKTSYNNRANAYKKEKKYKKAFADYQKAIELDPKYPRVYFNRGNIYKELGEYSKALNDYDTAIRLNPEYAQVYFNRGNIYKEQRQYTEALDDYEIALGLKPKWAKVYNNVANIFVSLNESERSSEIYKRALGFKLDIKNNSDSIPGQNDFQDLALESYTKALEINPYYMVAYHNRASIYSAQGKYYTALKDYDMALSLEPLPRTYLSRAQIYAKLGKYDFVVEDYNRVIEALPDNAQALWGRSRVYFAIGEIQKALDDAIKAESLSKQKKPMDLKRNNEYINQLKQLIIENNINEK